jgi:hypothetical protein
MTTLFHGSYSDTAPVIKVGAFAMSGENVFDGLFASADVEIAESHGSNVHSYDVSSIADSSDLNANFETVLQFLSNEIEADAEQIEALAIAICDDECDDQFCDILSPRSSAGGYAAASWEMQRLRGQAAKILGFQAVKMNDEHGTSYLIVKH